MDSLVGQTFRIVLAEGTNPWIGADNRDNCVVKPLITGGQMKDWSIKDGCLVLDDVFYCTVEENKVVVRYGMPECIKWEIIQVEENLYLIKLPGTNSTWTADPDVPSKSPVTLTPNGSVNPKYQLLRLVAM